MFNVNVLKCLADSGASSNIMSYSMFQGINDVLQLTTTRIIQLDRSDVKVIGEFKCVHIVLASDLRVYQVIDIFVVDIPKSYGLLLSRDWSSKFKVIFLQTGPTFGSHTKLNPIISMLIVRLI